MMEAIGLLITAWPTILEAWSLELLRRGRG
jgi:hypothetical protein